MSAILKGLGGVALAAAVLYGMQRTTPGYGEITSPRPVAGKLGHRLEARAFAIDIAKVQLARTVATKGAAARQHLHHLGRVGAGRGYGGSASRKPDAVCRPNGSVPTASVTP